MELCSGQDEPERIEWKICELGSLGSTLSNLYGDTVLTEVRRNSTRLCGEFQNYLLAIQRKTDQIYIHIVKEPY